MRSRRSGAGGWSGTACGRGPPAGGGRVAARADGPEVRRIGRRHAESPEWRGRVVWYGLRPETADVRGLDLTPEPDGAVGSRPRLPAAAESRGGGRARCGRWPVPAPGPGGAGGTRLRPEAGGESREVGLPLHGLYNVENC